MLTSATLRLVVTLASISLFGGCLLYFGVRILNLVRPLMVSRRNLQQRGVVTQAEITELVPESNIKFSFSVPDSDGNLKSVLSFADITAADFHRVKVGDLIQVRYLPENPARNVIEQGAKESVTTAKTLLIGLLLAGAGVFVLGGVAIVAVLSIARLVK